MKIAIIAWGSLIWDPRTLKIKDRFKPTGPHLPLEFARISKDGRLTLAISKKYGTGCRTYVATSQFTNMEQAVENLWERESGPRNFTPGWFKQNNHKFTETVSWYVRGQKHPNELQYRIMKEWIQGTDYDAVIWTSLKVKFYEKTKKLFTPQEAVKYLKKLDPEARARAIEYIENAPPEMRTYVRALVNIYRTMDFL